MSSQYAAFGEKFELARLQHNLMQSDLAKQFKVSQQTISRWEDLARKLRNELSKEEQCILIDQYFPGMRYNLLGIPEISS